MKTLSVWFGCLLLLIGCLPDPLAVDEIPQLKPRLVISSQVLPDGTLLVLVTRSVGALEASRNSDPQELLNSIAVNDALVTVEVNSQIDTLNLVENGVYGSTSVPLIEEQVYTLRIRSSTYGEVSATTQLKAAAAFQAVEAHILDTGYDTLARVSFAFTDLPGKNYYIVTVQHLSAEEPPEPSQFLNPAVFTHLMEDRATQDGALMQDTIKVFFRRDFIPGDTIMVQLANISQGYYRFLELRKDSRFNFSDFLGEPINYPTNVQGGLGWFNLHLPDVVFITVEEE